MTVRPKIKLRLVELNMMSADRGHHCIVSSSNFEHKYECTTDQELTDADAHMPGGRFLCTHQMAAPLSVK